MTKYDKYIFGFLFAICMIMIFACKDNSTNTAEAPQTNGTATDKTYTSEGTISSGSKDTMNDHTNGIQTDSSLRTQGEVPVKGETVSNANKE